MSVSLPKSQYHKEWSARNRHKIRGYYHKHKAKRQAKARETYAANWDKFQARVRAYRERNRLKMSEYKKRWALENRKRLNAMARERITARRAADPAFRILSALRCRLRMAMLGKMRTARTLELLGCSVEELMGHMERKFVRGMTRANYGLWHIDHIRPCVTFDLTDPAQQRACFHYTNLQPLWAKINRLKHTAWQMELSLAAAGDSRAA